MLSTEKKPPGLYAGIATIVATVFAMALADAIVKFASSQMPLWQIWVLRAVIVVPVFAAFGWRHLFPDAFGWVLLRSLALVFMYLGIYAALPLLELSVVAASLYTSPLFITLLSALVLREPVRMIHWLAVAIGLAGVLLIVRPAAEGFRPLALVPVAAAFLYSVAAVITRAKCGQVPATVMALWLNLSLLACGCAAIAVLPQLGTGLSRSYPFLFASWQPLTARNLWVILALSALMLGIGVGLARAYKSPDPQIIAVFDYSFLIFAALWGYVFFGEVPDTTTGVGMGLIALAGALAVMRRRACVNSAAANLPADAPAPDHLRGKGDGFRSAG